MYDDASAMASAINALADDGKEIVLVMSSYGGFPGTEAAFGLSKASRAKKGLQGGIISLVYIAAFIPQLGQCIKELTGGMPGEEAYMHLDYSPEFANAVFNDLATPEEQKKYFDMMNDHSRVSFDGQLKHEGWKGVKSYYMHTQRDLVVPPELQLRMIDAAKRQGGNVEVIATEFGHVPMIGSKESEKGVAELLVKAAGLWPMIADRHVCCQP